ncbi:MAG: DUF3489 domain-containing protein [Roseomonas sp.]|jgi:hypothetical protein|nr:DUF3489 domain-containing protein [Roseomonas sp.]MCA3431013.1 DUF3489 domain-containing protein [Roseomonas sp.]MCA3434284.1 DUF3489 domain-containing protein [Roseomonas sp.]
MLCHAQGISPAADEDKQMSKILPTENQDWGFWGTMREHAAEAWPIAFTAIHNATSTDPVAHAMDMLRSALTRRGTRATGAPRKPREGTKQEVVLAMLRRPEGATVAQIAEATGWAQHTVRGFFAGLKKRQGITVEIAERIRQVGPNKQGAKGSYTVYRVAE